MPYGRLLPGPSASLADGLAHLRKAIDAAWPLQRKHKAALPGGVTQLSELLTTDRDHLPPDYMSRPEFLSAYLHWFLPWNVFRQGRLLQGLGLDIADGTRVLDLGAGPFTFLVALWLARPDLRDRELHYLAVDRADSALKAGRRLFTALAGDDIAWRVSTARQTPRGEGRADLLVAANLVNELESDRGGRRKGPDLDPREKLVIGWERLLKPGAGRMLIIEPGVRPAAAQLVRLRGTALERGWRVAAPCPHQETCPLPGRHGGSWCHFSTDTDAAPDWLAALGRKAQLPKERASLSFMLLEPSGGEGSGEGEEALGPVRIVSDDFALPDHRRGRYGCSARGLLLLRSRSGRRSAGPVSGDLVTITWPEVIERDPRSHAVIVELER